MPGFGKIPVSPQLLPISIFLSIHPRDLPTGPGCFTATPPASKASPCGVSAAPPIAWATYPFITIHKALLAMPAGIS